MADPLHCWKCGSPLQGLILPMSRREECARCGADQHVCKLCKHYKATVADACTEDRAEAVTDKERANFCDYFQPGGDAFVAAAVSDEAKARQELAALFGDEVPESEDKDIDNHQTLSESDAALSELEKLFNND
ncbi:hypothetical protein [Oceanicoccus sagamiensis]|uniref:Uncharacterized protein n=1 Tax=Oceanicoccus sagamiensis TaxID=716816 RepID=A0A1X9NF55_9GAMM|nr:hypothetical protein [Oceanicoccus sagamiensis]ARN75072.1 hypothetical protein BST96_13675 [Oceanicoccus sagamiensis]